MSDDRAREIAGRGRREIKHALFPDELTCLCGERFDTKLDAACHVGDRFLVNQIINTPETADFVDGVKREAAHQRERWGSDHDGGKTPFDWFWLIGYLAQKAATSEVAGDVEKAKHHTISTAAALANWHLALSGVDNRMRPGSHDQP